MVEPVEEVRREDDRRGKGGNRSTEAPGMESGAWIKKGMR